MNGLIFALGTFIASLPIRATPDNKNKMNVITLFILCQLSLFPGLVQSGLVLSKKIMDLTLTAAELSALAYADTAPNATMTKDYTAFGYYNHEPDQALTAATKDGYCFVAFRGTSSTWDDWKQNFEIGNQDVCVTVGGAEHCCTSRIGFFGAYNTPYRSKVEKEVRNCAKNCADKDECVVITGHSQGGAVATVAALFLADLNPYVITFGQPPTVDAPCTLIPSSRMYRFVNTKKSDKSGIAYDPVPMSPGLGADHFGNMIVLGPDDRAVAFIGLDAQEYLHPFSNGIEAHMMTKGTTPYPGYLDRIHTIMASGAFPIRSNGYVAGSLCSEDIECESKECRAESLFTFKRCVGVQCNVDSNCTTGRCDSGMCISKATSCMGCDEDSDCAGNGQCYLFKCTNEQGLMDNDCICLQGRDCDSGRCEGLLNPICEARLALGASCNEHSDCMTNYCSWEYVCDVPVESLGTRGPVESSGTLGPFAWVLISIVVIAGVWLTWKFVLQRRNGYEEITSTTMDV